MLWIETMRKVIADGPQGERSSHRARRQARPDVRAPLSRLRARVAVVDIPTVEATALGDGAGLVAPVPNVGTGEYLSLRALGARDVVFGVGALRALRRDEREVARLW